jgi:hypothetical protein
MSSKPISQQFQDELCEVIDRHRDQGITISEVIGCFELVKLDLWKEVSDPIDCQREEFLG